MAWYKRFRQGILTRTSEKKEAPEGVWLKCPKCKETLPTKKFKENFYICNSCQFHFRIGSKEYYNILFDEGDYDLLFTHIKPKDHLNFNDLKSYKKRLKRSKKKTGFNDALQSAKGRLDGRDVLICCMDFSFIGGSMGAVVGEKIARSIDKCIEEGWPLIIVSKSGGARMMESAFALMQMAKTAGKLTQLSKSKIPYISLMTDPTTGGVTASFAMLGDINMAEPEALIGFAGPRVIRQTIRKDLPEGFQSSEFLLDHGFLDFIVDRKNIKERISRMLYLFEH